MDAQPYHKIREYLTKKTYPKRMKLEWQKKNFRRDCRNFQVQKGMLFRKGKGTNLRAMRERELEELQKDKRYFSKGLFEKVKKYVENCDVCQRKASLKKTKKPLHPIQVPDAAFSKIGMDLIGPLEETKDARFACSCVVRVLICSCPLNGQSVAVNGCRLKEYKFKHETNQDTDQHSSNMAYTGEKKMKSNNSTKYGRNDFISRKHKDVEDSEQNVVSNDNAGKREKEPEVAIKSPQEESKLRSKIGGQNNPDDETFLPPKNMIHSRGVWE
ncbi:hypothetical protein CHS0354_012946 [Potamilus streckersoni]|uniref:Integrase zinc-binding domain-containing protein n=1 Tax=Potamilus streckersoni TaxID=2493646 RepID=A0AAE0RP10_9BIVA|nr:hypothetical protein CHS0354_012946 [Potamilus streckersoni]